MGPRVVITGIGMVTPVGLDAASTWSALLAGQSGLAPITLFDASRISCGIAAEVKGFDGEAVVGKREARKMDRCGLMTVQAAREAWTASGAEVDDPTRVGVVIGSCVGGFAMLEAGARQLEARGPDRISPHLIGAMLVDTPTSYVATDLGVRGPNFAVVSACATGAHAIGEAAEMVRRGDADRILAGGVEACITELILGGFCNMRALGSPRDPDDPASASRPFDATRDGFIVGEGAAVVVLEREDDARARRAPIVAELVGYGASNDAFHIAHPHPEGIGVVEMMRGALARTGVQPEEIGYINPHGTSTPLNDSAETAAIRTVFGAHADRLAVSSTKSMTGHLFGGAGALETAVCALAVRDGIVPPTINLQERDPACDLDYVAEGARRIPDLRYAISNSMGLGGHNGCTLLARV
jgi:3-oxoacyl-[acyl-carrier-protein] synthase II